MEHHGFSQLHLTHNVATPLVENSAAGVQLGVDCDMDFCFATVDAFLDFITKRWQERWVTVDILDEGILECLLRRPFFLFVSIDAPVSLRWKRFKERYYAIVALDRLQLGC